MKQIIARQEAIIEEFSMLDNDTEMMLNYIIELGQEIGNMADEDKVDENLVKGCQSKVWMTATLMNGKMNFKADSNTLITKGLVSLLLRVFDQTSPEETLKTEIYFPKQIGMNRFIGTQRSNGFAAIIKQIKCFALAFNVKNKNMDTTIDNLDQEKLKEDIVQAIKKVYDPEIPVDIYELGLIYEINILPINNVEIIMTLTSPSCPAAESIPSEVEANVRTVKGVNNVNIELTFDPPYATDMMSEEARLELGFM